jgi:hypothetical protein
MPGRLIRTSEVGRDFRLPLLRPSAVPCVTKQRESRNLPVCVVAPIAARPPAPASSRFSDFRARQCGSPAERKRSRPKPQAARMRCVTSVPVAAASCMVATSERTINSRSTPAPWMILRCFIPRWRSSPEIVPNGRSCQPISKPSRRCRPNSSVRWKALALPLQRHPASSGFETRKRQAREPHAVEVNSEFVGLL